MGLSSVLELPVGLLLFALAVVFRAFPPATINHLYGYRTQRSMLSKEIWDEANRYSANLMIIFAVLVLLVQVIVGIYCDRPASTLWTALTTIISLLILILLTERRLRHLFDENGVRRA